ncbi:MAG: hypothetical protein JKY22_10955 [Flavobacteriaceae bacterium]|nr:hypothetical protein [Flavobacteriaceae bacterium]
MEEKDRRPFMERGANGCLVGFIGLIAIFMFYFLIIYQGSSLLGNILELLPWYVWIIVGLIGLYVFHEWANKKK